MSSNVKALEQLEFHGVYTNGNPIQRPRNTAERCEDFRVMPGLWLRLRSGRKARYNTAGGQILQFSRFRQVDYDGSDNQLAQVIFSGAAQWHWFSLLNYIVAPSPAPGFTQIETIDISHDGGFALSRPAAICNITDRPVMYNGLGTRDGTVSKPPFTHYFGGQARYFGLDCYCPGGAPSASFSAGAGHNQVQTSVDIYVGLYEQSTDHYSNAVHAGQITTTSGMGTINVTSLGNLKYATHGSGETSGLFYVFYATIDNGQVPYLILDSALDGPYKVAVGSSSASLSIATGTTNGWNLDLTHERPIANFPPQPMRSICFVNGRLYGVPMVGGQGLDSDFSYVPRDRDLTSVCWSAAASDSVDVDFLGDPLQSWPLLNRKYTPSGEQPVIVAPAQDGTRVLVITQSSTFLLEEQADGVHEFFTISRTHGIANPTTLKETPYGLTWMSQRNQIVQLPPGVMGVVDSAVIPRQLKVLSDTYSNLLTASPRCADYILDPVNQIDRYQVWLSDGTSVCHDFGVGETYSETGQDFTAAMSAVDASGHQHHIVAKGGLYTHEGQPEDNRIPAYDATFTNTSDQTSVVTPINGVYVRNWDDFGDADVQKELPSVDVIGDVNPSALLSASPVSLEWYADFAQFIDANKQVATPKPIRPPISNPTFSNAYNFRYGLTDGNRFWFKLVFKLAGHQGDDTNFLFYQDTTTQGNLAKNFYGSILRALWRLGISQNRA